MVAALRAAAGFALAAGLAGPAAAGGYAVKEISTAGLGSAYAGSSAEAADVTQMAANPATLGWLPGSSAALALSYVAPRPRYHGGSSRPAASPVPVPAGDGPDSGEDAVVPNVFLGWAPSPEWRLGLAVTAPWGLATEHPDGWAGRYYGLKSELRSVNLNPVAAWRPHPALALAAGVQLQYLDSTLDNAVDFGSIGTALGVPGALPGAQDGKARLKGEDWGAGWNAGIIVAPTASTRIGLAYRSSVEHTLRGRASFTLDKAGVGATLRANTGLFTDTDAKAAVRTPESASLGIYHEVVPNVALLAEGLWTRWSRFRELRIRFADGQPDDVTEQRWHDTWHWALGVRWQATERLGLRAGAAIEGSPVPDQTRNPRVPDADRRWLAVGASWKAGRQASLDFAWAHIFVDDAAVALSAAAPGNTFRGDLSGRFENSIDLVTLQGRWDF